MQVFIPTAGLGTRLKDKTNNLNKSLLDINYTPIISHIIEKFPNNTKFTVALGYKGDQVKQYLKIVYKNKKINFVNIYPFKGPKSGLGLTLIKSKKYLHKPFIFISCDTLVQNKIKDIKDNWIGYSNKKSGKNYRSIESKNNQLIKINEKNNKFKNKKTYIGLCYIKDYKKFWKFTKTNFNQSKNQGEVAGLNYLAKEKRIYTKKFDWNDVGNISEYYKTKSRYLKSNLPVILPKNNESIWFVNSLVVKYSLNKEFIKKRVLRSKLLKNFVPKIINQSKNMYAYKYIDGKIMSKNLNLNNFKKLLSFLSKFWKKNSSKNQKKFRSNCLNFYKRKTLNRIKMFNKRYKYKDKVNNINNVKVEKLNKLMNKIEWTRLSNGISSRFHGDLHFENIIINKNSFKLLDWRQDFEKDLKSGDLYYDLAKLMHGIIVDHNQVKKNNFKVEVKGNKINISIKKTKNHKICLKYFEQWILDNGFDLIKVRIITALIYLNIAPLHHYPYSLFLYYLGKKMLSDELEKLC